jgi:hypothetical protein
MINRLLVMLGTIINAVKEWVLAFINQIGYAETIHQAPLDQSMLIEIDAVNLSFEKGFRVFTELYPEYDKLFNCFLKLYPILYTWNFQSQEHVFVW